MSGRRPVPGEFEIIERYFAPLTAGEPGAFGLADDAAVVAPRAGGSLVVTTDAVVAGVHFPPDALPEDIACKALAVNVSDVAAMGARPWLYTLALAMPESVDDGWLARFSGALATEQAAFGVTLVGGDTVATPGPLTLSVTMVAVAEQGRVLRRSGARPGDAVYVSGTVGDAALGLLTVRGDLAGIDDAARRSLAERYHRPRPRVDLGLRLNADGLARAAIDVSDGLIADLGHICAESGVGSVVELPRVPLSDAARQALAADAALMEAVLAGGDDYELVFTAPPSQAATLTALARDLDLPLTEIGHIDDGPAGGGGPPVRVRDVGGRVTTPARDGYRHFRADPA